MYRADSLVRGYIRNSWNRYLEPLNTAPVKFEVNTELHSAKKLAIPPGRFELVLDHLVTNSMIAISGFKASGQDIMEAMEVDVDGLPESCKGAMGRIVLRTRNEGKYVIVEIEDDWGGIDPGKVREMAHTCGIPPLDEKMGPYDMINSLFARGFSTYNPTYEEGGIGLAESRDIVEEFGGRIYIAGTTYVRDGKIFADSWRDYITVGNHPKGKGSKRKTGTIIQMEFPSTPQKNPLPVNKETKESKSLKKGDF